MWFDGTRTLSYYLKMSVMELAMRITAWLTLGRLVVSKKASVICLERFGELMIGGVLPVEELPRWRQLECWLVVAAVLPREYVHGEKLHQCNNQVMKSSCIHALQDKIDVKDDDCSYKRVLLNRVPWLITMEGALHCSDSWTCDLQGWIWYLAW